MNLRLIPTEPFTANLLRLDLLVAALARQPLWITDAYFIGTGPYLEALKRAAADGVDVRLLLPQGSDVGWTVPVSRRSTGRCSRPASASSSGTAR